MLKKLIIKCLISMDRSNLDLCKLHLSGLIKQLHIVDELQKVQKRIGKKRKLQDEYEEPQDGDDLEKKKIHHTRSKSLKSYKKGQEIESLKEKELKLNEDLQNRRRENNLLISLVSLQNKPVLETAEIRPFLKRMASGCGCYTGTCPGPLFCNY